MTIYEKLFGTPERAAKTLDALAVGQLEVCWLMDELCSDKEKKCELCRYEYDHYGCEDVGVTCIDWLTRGGDLMTDTEKAALERRIDELCAKVEQGKAENAKLRDENANLRELVRMMWKSYCWANSGYETYLTDEQDVKVRNLVRKLGIEAPS